MFIPKSIDIVIVSVRDKGVKFVFRAPRKLVSTFVFSTRVRCEEVMVSEMICKFGSQIAIESTTTDRKAARAR